MTCITHLLRNPHQCDRRRGVREQEILSCVLPTGGATNGGAWGHPGPTAVRLWARISTDLCCRRRHASIRIFIAGGGPQAGGNCCRDPPVLCAPPRYRIDNTPSRT